MALQIGINELKELANKMTEVTGYPFSDMQHSFLKRRLGSFLEKSRVRNVDQFTNQLTEQHFRNELLYSFPVECTELFRDPGFWRILNAKVLPKISDSKLPVWFPDASTGEEIMSLLVLLHYNNIKLQTIFNHPSNKRISEIEQGQVYIKDLDLAESNCKRLELNISLADYTVEQSNLLMFKPHILDNLTGKTDWFLKEGLTTTSASLIIMRNTTLYLNKPTHEKLMQFIYSVLSPGGYLAIGIKEYLPESILEKMDIVDKQEQIYKKPGIINA
jgi:chemotaxis protein methyltransferase CheR